MSASPAEVPGYLATRDDHSNGCRYNLAFGGWWRCECGTGTTPGAQAPEAEPHEFALGGLGAGSSCWRCGQGEDAPIHDMLGHAVTRAVKLTAAIARQWFDARGGGKVACRVGGVLVILAREDTIDRAADRIEGELLRAGLLKHVQRETAQDEGGESGD